MQLVQPSDIGLQIAGPYNDIGLQNRKVHYNDIGLQNRNVHYNDIGLQN